MIKSLLDYFNRFAVISKFRKQVLIREKKIAKISFLVDKIVKRQGWKDEYIGEDKIKKVTEILIYCTNDYDDFDYYIGRWVLDDNIYILTKDYLCNFKLGGVFQLSHNINTLKKMPLTDYVKMSFNSNFNPPNSGSILFIEKVVIFYWMHEWQDLKDFLLKIQENSLKLPVKNCNEEVINFPLQLVR